jgi:hypothetical protein
MGPVVSGSEPVPERGRPTLARAAIVLLVLACAYFGLRLAGVDGRPPLPAGLPAEGVSIVVAGPGEAWSRDARELRIRRPAAALAAAQTSAVRERAELGSHPKRRSNDESPPTSGGDGDDSGGAGDAATDPNLTLPVVGVTPIPDPGIQVPELPVEPGTLPDARAVLPGAGGTVPEAGVPLP